MSYLGNYIVSWCASQLKGRLWFPFRVQKIRKDTRISMESRMSRRKRSSNDHRRIYQMNLIWISPSQMQSARNPGHWEQKILSRLFGEIAIITLPFISIEHIGKECVLNHIYQFSCYKTLHPVQCSFCKDSGWISALVTELSLINLSWGHKWKDTGK